MVQFIVHNANSNFFNLKKNLIETLNLIIVMQTMHFQPCNKNKNQTTIIRLLIQIIITCNHINFRWFPNFNLVFTNKFRAKTCAHYRIQSSINKVTSINKQLRILGSLRNVIQSYCFYHNEKLEWALKLSTMLPHIENQCSTAHHKLQLTRWSHLFM